ncbi:MAG: acetamidase/formamidase family protein [Rhodospirillaceae bacterium]
MNRILFRSLILAAAGALAVAAYAQSPGPSPGPADSHLRIAPAPAKPGKTWLLPATLETTQWGWFDNAQAPVLTIASGDTVVMETMMHAHNQIVPGTTIAQIKKMRTDFPGRGPHSLTGPIYVTGAAPGDVLKIHINKIVPRTYATNFNVPGMFGEFPKDFPEGQVHYVYLDVEKKTAEFIPGVTVPLRPFPGTIGVARAEPGQYSSVPPGRFGGNMDIREMVEGTTLYVPVFVEGALVWSGDSHAAQGNGEVNLTALETAFKELNLTIDVIKGKSLQWPRVETPSHWLTVGYDQDLNKALEIVKTETAGFIAETRKVSPKEAAALMLKTWDCPVAEVVNIVKGIYCFNAKGAPVPTALPAAETPEDYVTTGTDADLNKAMDQASMAMIGVIMDKRKLSRLDSYGVASIAMDCRVAPHTGGPKKVHCMLPKSIFTGKP